MTWRAPTPEQERRAPLVDGHTFWEALCFALGSVEPHSTGADPRPLADYIASDVPLTRDHRLMLADFIRILPVRQMPGNPLNAPDLELRAAAKRVDQAKQDWLVQHPDRKNVPTQITNGFIADAIRYIADQRGAAIPPHSGLYVMFERRIRTALKGQHF